MSEYRITVDLSGDTDEKTAEKIRREIDRIPGVIACDMTNLADDEEG